jgi:hypothetical protein
MYFGTLYTDFTYSVVWEGRVPLCFSGAGDLSNCGCFALRVPAFIWQSQWPRGLRRRSLPLGYWGRGFEYRSKHGCLSLCCPLQAEAFATGWLLVQSRPTKCLKITKPPVWGGRSPYEDCRATVHDDSADYDDDDDIYVGTLPVSPEWSQIFPATLKLDRRFHICRSNTRFEIFSGINRHNYAHFPRINQSSPWWGGRGHLSVCMFRHRNYKLKWNFAFEVTIKGNWIITHVYCKADCIFSLLVSLLMQLMKHIIPFIEKKALISREQGTSKV